MGAMRGSYMMISGIAQILGTSMSQVFSSLYAIAYSSIEIFSAIAAAQFFVPGMQLQSMMMVASLVTAIVGLAGVATAQQDLSRGVSAIHMTLQGFSTMIGGFHFS